MTATQPETIRYTERPHGDTRMTGAWQHVDAVVKWLESRNGSSEPAMSLVKISEELGEAAQAYTGLLGRNPRKGVTHSGDDVAAELCDVILSAMVALHDFTDEPDGFFARYVATRAERLHALTA